MVNPVGKTFSEIFSRRNFIFYLNLFRFNRLMDQLMRTLNDIVLVYLNFAWPTGSFYQSCSEISIIAYFRQRCPKISPVVHLSNHTFSPFMYVLFTPFTANVPLGYNHHYFCFEITTSTVSNFCNFDLSSHSKTTSVGNDVLSLSVVEVEIDRNKMRMARIAGNQDQGTIY